MSEFLKEEGLELYCVAGIAVLYYISRYTFKRGLIRELKSSISKNGKGYL